MIERAEGAWLVGHRGRRYIDGVSSLWCNVHGHRHPRIDAAVRDQLDRVAHTTMLGLSHPSRGRSQLARSRPARDRRPGPLTRVFYSDSGSTAVEVALKMAFQYWQQAAAGRADAVRLSRGRLPRRHRRLGVGGRDRPVPLALPAAAVRRASGSRPGDADALERRCSRDAPTEIAAVVVEPLVQGAAGHAAAAARVPARRCGSSATGTTRS